MRQSRAIMKAALALAMLAPAGCSDGGHAATQPASSSIVSLTPAGTDLLSAMGLADRLVGVSSYESNETLRRKLPKVGDYLRVDFERLADLRPAYIITQGRHDRMPAGTREKCDELHINPIILQIDRLADIETAVRQIGRETGETSAAARLLADMARRTDAVRAAAVSPAVAALIVFSDSGTQVVGRDTFIDDALTLAGGVNVVSATGYATIDSEKMRSLRPRVVFLLLPAADGVVVDRAKAALAAAGVTADTTIVPITDADVLMPGTAALRLAENMAAHLRAGS